MEQPTNIEKTLSLTLRAWLQTPSTSQRTTQKIMISVQPLEDRSRGTAPSSLSHGNPTALETSPLAEPQQCPLRPCCMAILVPGWGLKWEPTLSGVLSIKMRSIIH